MRKYKNKKLGFTFYVDTWKEHTDEKLRVYDSNKDYCDYIEEFSIINNCEHLKITPERYVKELVKILKNADDMYDFMKEFSYDFTIEENVGQEQDDLTNVFGNYLIFMR